MQHIQEGGNCIARCLSNLRLLDEGVIKQSDSVLFFLIHVAPGLTTFSLLPGCRAGDVEPHLRELVPPSSRLSAFPWCRAILAVGFAGVGDGEFDSDLVATSKVRVGNLRVWDLESWPVLHIEREFSLAKLGLAPIPTAQRVFLIFQVGAVPVLEDLTEALIILIQGQQRLGCIRYFTPTSC